jgi:hypothetical protein
LAQDTFINAHKDVNFFYLPAELLKTSQINSYTRHPHADPDKIIHHHRVKDADHKQTGEVTSVTLSEFRKKYNVTALVNKGIHSQNKSQSTERSMKEFGTYTLHKATGFERILEERWKVKQHKAIIELLAMLAATHDDFESKKCFTLAADNTPGNEYLGKLLKRDDCANVFGEIFDYLALVKTNKNNYPPETVANVEKVIELVTKLVLDDAQPGIRVNLKYFIDWYYTHVDSEAVELAREIKLNTDKVINSRPQQQTAIDASGKSSSAVAPQQHTDLSQYYQSVLSQESFRPARIFEERQMPQKMAASENNTKNTSQGLIGEINLHITKISNSKESETIKSKQKLAVLYMTIDYLNHAKSIEDVRYCMRHNPLWDDAIGSMLLSSASTTWGLVDRAVKLRGEDLKPAQHGRNKY